MYVNLKTIINIDFASAFFNSCAVAFSVPTVKLYMASNVDPMYFKISLAIDTIAGGGFGLFMSGELISRLRPYLALFCFIDALTMLIINLVYGTDPNMRFILISLTSPISTYFVFTIIANIYDNVLSGNDRTTYRMRLSSFSCIGKFIGVITALFINIDINSALLIQSSAICCTEFINVLIGKGLINILRKNQ